LNDSGVGVDYADFYHFLNGLVDYDNWGARIDYKSKHLRLFRQQNVWNESNSIHQAFEQLFSQFRNSIMAISYRSNGIPTIDELVGILECLGKNVRIYQSSCIKYVLSNKQSNEVLIVAR
jgi:adenine-specific DNA methylase